MQYPLTCRSVITPLLLLSASLALSSCRDGVVEEEGKGTDSQASHAVGETAPEKAEVVAHTASSEEEILALRREIDAREQTIEDLQAAVDMERAKIEENPDYDPSFLLGVEEEQQELREAIKADEAKLEALSKSAGLDPSGS